jgi:hypothetical protein
MSTTGTQERREENRVGDLSDVALPHKKGPPKPHVAISRRDSDQYFLVLHALQGDLVLSHTIAIVICAVTGRTQTQQNWRGIVWIMVDMGGVQVNCIHDSGSFGDMLRSVFDLAADTSPACLFLTLSGLLFPILGIALSPFGLHKVLHMGGKYPQVIEYPRGYSHE